MPRNPHINREDMEISGTTISALQELGSSKVSTGGMVVVETRSSSPLSREYRPFPVITPFVNPSTFQTIYSTSCQFKAFPRLPSRSLAPSCIGTRTRCTHRPVQRLGHRSVPGVPMSTGTYIYVYARTREPTSCQCHRCTPLCISMKQVSELVGPRLLQN